MRNDWGFNSIGFFAPDDDYAAFGQGSEQVREFKGIVRALHEAGLGVILDVVYNHTAEGNQLGPSLETAHDGFTLADLVSYNRKHNEANGEDNADGEDHNRSWSCGAETPSTDPDVIAWRMHQPRNFIATLLLSQGVPMPLGGDKIGRTQQGNNNAYCQDNENSWYDRERVNEELWEFT